LQDTCRKSPLHERHIRLGAKMIDFAGWYMPLHYGSMVTEHKAVRTSAGLFDVSHMGEIEMTGPGSRDLVYELVTNDTSMLEMFQVQYSVMCNHAGGCLDDLLIYRLPERWLLIVNATNITSDFEWISSHAGDGVEVGDVSDQSALLALQGPESESILQKLCDQDLSRLSYYWCFQGKVAGINALVSRTGYTGEDGFEIMCSPEAANSTWDDIIEVGKEYGVVPCGLGARDSLRLEAAFRLYGNDMDQSITPLEAGLGWVVKLEKDRFIGKDALEHLKAGGLKRRMRGLEMEGRGIARRGYGVFQEGRKVGKVTSGGFSPTLEKGIALAMLDSDTKNTVNIDIRGKMHSAEIVKPPFYKRQRPQGPSTG
jgi:aminomethyltransferase